MQYIASQLMVEQQDKQNDISPVLQQTTKDHWKLLI